MAQWWARDKTIHVPTPVRLGVLLEACFFAKMETRQSARFFEIEGVAYQLRTLEPGPWTVAMYRGMLPIALLHNAEYAAMFGHFIYF